MPLAMNFKLLGLLLLLALLPACSTKPSMSLPPQAPLVVKPAEIPELSDTLKKKPPPSGSYLKRAEQREQAMQESLKTSPAK